MAYQADSGSYTPESMRLRRRLAEAMLEQGLDTSPISSHWQGLARIAKAAIGGYGAYKLGEEEKAQDREATELLANAFGLGDGPSASSRSAPEASTGDKSLPRSVRTNNPGAIEYGNFAKSAGATGTDGRFAIFPDMETGYQAAERLIDSYQKNHGLNTTRGIISRWAPPNVDNNSTDQYIASVSKDLGIGPDDPIPPEMRSRLVQAMARFEAGRPVPRPGVEAAAQSETPLVPGVTAPGTTQPPPDPAPLPDPPLPVGGGPAVDRAALRRMLGNPRTRAMAVQLANDERKREAELGKPTDELREYIFDMRQRRARGETNLPSFGQWKADVRRAGATRVNVGGQEGAFAREIGKQQAERVGKLNSAAELAQTQLDNLDAVESGLNEYNKGSLFGTGRFGPYEAAVRSYAQGLGIGDAKTLGGAELANAIQNRMALLMRNPDGGMGMPGALSDADREFLKASQAGIDKTPEGNRKLIEYMRRLERRKIEIAQLANEYVSAKGSLDGFDQVMRKYADQNPLFPEARNAAAYKKAREAIARGASREAVIQRLREAGIDPAGL